VATLERVLHEPMHPERFRSQAKALTWRHSPYNPDVQRDWANLLGLTV
jgi:hypothetical protein